MRPPDDSRFAEPSALGDERGASALLRSLLPARTPSGPVLFVGAHPGDVVLGASWLLRRSPGGHVVHVADGLPRGPTPGPGGWDTSSWPHREEESFQALALAGLPREHLLSLGARPWQAAGSLVPLTECLMALLKALRPALLLGPPYAGEHPDADSTAFISHAAVALMVRAGRTPPVLLEMAGAPTGTFPATPQAVPEALAPFTEADRLLRQRMLACYGSRAGEWRRLPALRERYRLAPHYDFSRPPREAGSPSEARGPDVTGTHWRRLAREALEELKLPETPWH